MVRQLSDFESPGRPDSVCINAFSQQEWALSESILSLMKHLTDFNHTDTTKAIIQSSKQIVVCIRNLSLAIIEQSPNESEVIHARKADILTLFQRVINEIQNKIKNGLGITQELVDQVNEKLMDIAAMANEMLEIGLNAHKVLSKQAKYISSRFSNMSTMALPITADKAADEKPCPNGESFALFICPKTTPCVVCKEDLGTPCLSYKSKEYHPNCFKCVNCDNPVEAGSFLTLDDNPICGVCSPTCKTCLKCIRSNCFATLGSYFHLSCFSCTSCNVNIGKDIFYHRDGNPICKDCIMNTTESDKLKTHLNSLPITNSPVQSTPKAQSGLSEIVKSDKIFDAFMQYCKKDDSLNSLMFWMDTQQFAETSAKLKTAKDAAFIIWNKFLQSKAELNIRYLLRKETVQTIKKKLETKQIDATLFNEAQNQVIKNLETNVIPQFYQRESGKQVVKLITPVTVPHSPYPIDQLKRNPGYLISMRILLQIGAQIVGVEKRVTPSKHYVYEIQVIKAKDVLESNHHGTTMFKTYDEIREGHIALLRFHEKIMNDFPLLPSKTPSLFLKGRSKDRVKELNGYFESLFKMSKSVVQCAIMHKFLEK